MATWPLQQGSGDTWTVPIVDTNGVAIAYAGTEALAAKVWPGGTRAALLTLVPAWSSAPAGLTTLTITAAQSASLTPATYQVQCSVADASGTHTYYLGQLQVLPAPGTAVAAPSYCSIDDLREYAAWIDDLQSGTDQAGFAVQVGRARSWLDEILVSRWKYLGFAPQLGTPGWGAWSLYGGRDPMPSKWLRDQLANNLLMVTDTTREVTAKKALSYICRAQLGKNGDHSYQDLARGFAFEANELVKTYRAEIDLNGDGFADVYINCGATNLR
jgi:hypothetical protein